MTAKSSQPKPGYRTTEFIGPAITTIAMFFGVPVPPETAAIVAGVMWSIYIAGRNWIKSK